MGSTTLRTVTGWSLVVAGAGMAFDVWASAAFRTDGTVGLIPAYLGGTAGLVGLCVVVWRLAGPIPGLLCVAGTLGSLRWWYSYPAHVTAAGFGSIALGFVMLLLPGRWARFASPLWIAAGMLYFPELAWIGAEWGPLSGFGINGAACAATGAVLLWGLGDAEADSR